MCPFGLSVVLLALPPPEGADAPRSLRVEVVDETGADCVTPGALHQLIADTLDRPIETPGRDEVSDAEATVVARMSSRGRKAEIEVRAGAGRSMARTITVEDQRCREFLDSVALVTGLLLDELWQEARILFVPPTEVPPATASTPKLPDVPLPSPPPRWHVFVGFGADVRYGDLPGLAAGPTLRAEFASPRVVSFGILATGWPRATTGITDGGRARFAGFAAGAFLCPRFFERDRVSLAVCAAGRAGFISAVGEDLAFPGGATRPRAAVDAEFATRVRLGGPVWLRIGAGGSAILVRDSFEVLDADGKGRLVHRSWPVVPTGHLSLEIRAGVTGRNTATRQKK